MFRALLAFLILGLAATESAADSKPESVSELRARAEAGELRAAFELAHRLDYGRDIGQDREEAAKWYLVAAEGGIAEAQNSLGSLYQAGDGVPQDFSQALSWYQRAAEQNHSEALNNLAYLYDEGKGTAEDNLRAIVLYTKAAEQGFVGSMVNLGMMYRDGDGVPVDLLEAYKWIDLARFYTQHSKDKQLKWRVRDLLDRLKATMTPKDIENAESRARKWYESRK
jgi:TPR repeat protein